MRLHILGSSSSGNCYLLENDTECLILEAGINYKEIQKALEFNVSKISGCLVTHEHGDHAAYAVTYAARAINIYASAGTLEAIGVPKRKAHSLTHLKAERIGGFDVIPFAVMHDAKEPIGFLVRHADMGTLLFATDTYYLPNRFKGLNHVLIECNYAADILESNIANAKVARTVGDRVIGSHMELQTCKELLASNDLSAVDNIVLLHLSQDNSDKKRFKKEVMELTGKQVFVAEKGLVIDVSVMSF